MKIRAVLCIAVVVLTFSPALAQDALRGLAPADEYFGRFNLSILAIANTVRDAGKRIDDGADAHAMIAGPLFFATDAIHDWEGKYPSDPWIPKQLLALESVYLRAGNDEALRLATQTESWLVADYPSSSYAAQGRDQLANSGQAPQAARPALPSYASAWERFGALRVPLAPH